MTNKKDTYKIKARCSNCEFEDEVEIRKGIKIDEHPCPKCGNLGLKKPSKTIQMVPDIPDYD